MRRTMIIGAISATALTIGLGAGLGVGASLANADPSSTAPRNMTTMMGTPNGGHMPDTIDMTSMMDAAGMTNMMNGNGMTNMIDADGMTNMTDGNGMDSASTPPTTGVESGHTEHHPSVRP